MKYDLNVKISVTERPEPVCQPTESDKVRRLLTWGKPVLCGLSDCSQEDANRRARCVNSTAVVTHMYNDRFSIYYRHSFKYACRVDKTLLG